MKKIFKESSNIDDLMTNDQMLEESTRMAKSYNETHCNGQYKAVASSDSQIEYLVPNNEFLDKNIDSYLKMNGLKTNKTINEYTTKKPFQKGLKEMCTKYLLDDEYKNGTWLFISGQTGIGKTHLLSAIAKELAKREVRYGVLNYPEMKTMKDKYVKGDISKVNEYKRAPVLMIKSLWNDNVNNLDITIIKSILGYRDVNEMPTIITCNLTNEQNLMKINSEIYKYIKESASHYFGVIPYDEKNNFLVCGNR